MSLAATRDLARLEAKIDRLLRLLGGRDDQLISLSAAAEYLGYSTAHLRRLAVERREIPFHQARPAGKILFRKSDLDAYGPRPAIRRRTPGRPASQVTAMDII